MQVIEAYTIGFQSAGMNVIVFGHCVPPMPTNNTSAFEAATWVVTPSVVWPEAGSYGSSATTFMSGASDEMNFLMAFRYALPKSSFWYTTAMVAFGLTPLR